MSKALRFQVPVLILAFPLAVMVSSPVCPPAPLAAGLGSGARSSPQNQSSPDQSSPEQSSRDQSMETLKVNVDVVQLFFNVKDKKGGLIPSLTKDDFELSEDGQPQTIKYFAAESDLPLTLGILIDTSASQTRVLGYGAGGGRLVSQPNPARQRLGFRDQLRCRGEPAAGFHQLQPPAATALSSTKSTPRRITAAASRAQAAALCPAMGPPRAPCSTTGCTWPRMTCCRKKSAARP